MLQTKLIIVFGVSGVGKTTACADYSNRNHNILYYSASALLRLHRKTARMRTVDEAMQDQHALIDLVRALQAKTSAALLLLDAHSVVSVADREIVIPAAIISAMKPNGLIFFEAPGDVISKRRALRGDKTNLDPREIERLQLKALSAVEVYAAHVPCKLLVLDAGQETDLTYAIEKLS